MCSTKGTRRTAGERGYEVFMGITKIEMDGELMAQTKEGALKIAAGRVGLTSDEYSSKLAAGLKWCTGCKAWHERSAFRSDGTRSDGLAAMCNEVRRSRRIGAGRAGRREPAKEKARGLIASRVRRGVLPHPNSVPCFDCGHIGSEFRHEYDHFSGYEGENAGKVEAVCAKCHRRRERIRRANAA